MKICFLAASNSIHSHKWINYFADQGHKVIWISLVPATFNISDNIEYYEFTDGILYSIFKLRKLIAKLNPDVVHIHYLGYYALLGLFSGARCIVSTAWGSDIIFKKKSFFEKQIVSRILKKSKYVTCDAYFMRDELKKFNISEEKIHIINFGIDTKKFNKKEKRDIELLKKFNISDQITIISLRNFETVYDIKTLIYAAKIILNEISSVRFILVGKGYLENELKKLTKDLGISNFVNFTGFMFQRLYRMLA